MNNPLISVIIPVYNAEPFLPACLDSVLSQDYSSFEILVIDDGSTDNSAAIIDRYAAREPRIGSPAPKATPEYRLPATGDWPRPGANTSPSSMPTTG